MNRCVFTEKIDGTYQLYLFDDDEMVDNTYRFDALMMSRPDFDIKVIKIPNVQHGDEHDLLRYRIRSLYPGTPEETVFDHQIVNMRKERHAILFITKKHILEEYREIGNKKPLFLPYTIVNSSIKKYADKNCVAVFLHKYWTEILEFQQGILDSSIVLNIEKDIILKDFVKLQEFLPERKDDSSFVFFCSKSNVSGLQEVIGKSVISNNTYEIVSIEEQLDSLKIKNRFLFAEKRKRRLIPQKTRILLLVFLVLVLSGLGLFKYVSYKEQYKSLLAEQLSSLEKQYYRIASIKEETEDLESTFKILEEQQPIDVYLVLSRIFEVIGDRTLVTYFTFDNGSFQFEAVGSDALVLIQKFNSHPDFSDIKILQIVLDKGSDIERFRITGNVNVK